MSVITEDLETGEKSYVVCPYCGTKEGVTIEDYDYEEEIVYYDCRICDPEHLFTIDEAELQECVEEDEDDECEDYDY